jgi:polar amino acid transport system permease protein
LTFEFGYIVANLPALMAGLGMTVLVSVVSITLALLVGIAGATIRLFETPLLARLVAFYVEFIRNTPLLVQIFFIFFGLPSLGIRLSLFWSGVVALTVWGGAFNTENIRGGFLAINKGIQEAAQSLGLKKLVYVRTVALPLALRVSIPSLLNTAVSVLKNSAYLQAIGLAELTFVAMDRVSLEFRTLEMFAAIGVIYLGLVLVLSWLVRRVEHVLHRPFREA